MSRLPRPRDRRALGFTLLEVLVAIVLVSIGLLGFAKMQSLALSSTSVAGNRSVVAMQAGSLAAAMHGNRAFWSAGTAPASFSTSGATVVDGTGVLSATVATCVAAARPANPLCTPAQLAAYDVQRWAFNLANLLPTATSQTRCTTTATAAISCILTVTWTEKYVSATRAVASDSTATGGTRAYSLYIEP